MIETRIVCDGELVAGLESDGELSAQITCGYTVADMRPATTERIGGVIVGDGLLVEPDGRLSVASPQQGAGFLDDEQFMQLFD